MLEGPAPGSCYCTHQADDATADAHDMELRSAGCWAASNGVSTVRAQV